MSTRAEEFVTTLEKDPQLQSQLSSAATSEDRKKVVADAGFGDVSSAEVKTAIADKGQSDELSDDQLAAASGAGFGLGTPFGSISISW
jgi:predicted ribosomally synthesized peptide with nif11-like leader